MTASPDANAAPSTTAAGPSALPLPRLSAAMVGTVILLGIALPCIFTLPWSMQYYDDQSPDRALEAPSLGVTSADTPLAEDISWWRSLNIMGRDQLGRSLAWRVLLGGAISLGIGVAAAVISLIIGVTWGAVSGYTGGRTDAGMMRFVDVMYGLPYILLVVLVGIGLTPYVERAFRAVLPQGIEHMAGPSADVITLLIAIGAVSWLTMARVIRGQVLSLRALPFIEASRACGAGTRHIMQRHLLPNLVGPIVVYTTLTVPLAILQESFLSFLGIGVQAPLPSWGNLAADGVQQLHALSQGDLRWWLPMWPCLLLGLTLLALNFLGDALRNRVDPRSIAKR